MEGTEGAKMRREQFQGTVREVIVAPFTWSIYTYNEKKATPALNSSVH